MLSFNDDPASKPTIDVIQIDNLHEKFKYVAEYAQDRILVAHRITSPLLFGIRTASVGFSSQSDEMKTAFSILQTMTIQPFQGLILNQLDMALSDGGWDNMELYFEQTTPLAILSEQAEETDKTVAEVQDDTNKSLETPATTDDEADASNENEDVLSSGIRGGFFNKNYETI
jgi:hypothetical protein